MECGNHEASPTATAACLFPKLNTNSSDVDIIRHTSIPLDDRDIAAFSEHHGSKFIDLLQVAWAIVLRSYTGMDRLYFVYEHDPPPSSHGGGSPRARFLSHLDLSQDIQVSELARRIIRQAISSNTEDYRGCRSNTAVIQRSSPGAATCNGLDDFPAPASHGKTQGCSAPPYVLAVQAHEFQRRWTLSLQYRISVLSDSQARHVGHLVAHVLSQITGASISLNSVDLCPQAVIEQLSEWNQVPPRRSSDCIHGLILERCRDHPEAPAVCAWDGDFSYQHLSRLTASLSKHLRSQGIGPDKFVGIYFDKSKWTAIAILSVLRAGGAFALLDTAFPGSRLAEMCGKLRAELVLCSRKLTRDAAALGLPALAVDDQTIARLESQSPVMPPSGIDPQVRPHDAAFAVFTSGSTGVPKGITFSHASFCSGEAEVIKTIGYGRGQRVLQFASYAFDAAVQEHLTPLIAGACVCIPSDDACRSSLVEVIRQMSISLAMLTPTVARLLPPAEVPLMEKLVLIGESVLQSDIATWAGRLQLFNGYGPAECCVFTALHFYDQETTGPNIIGTGKGALCWVVDASNPQKLAPIGAIGELLVDGPIVGRGYVGDEAQTRSRFIQGPEWRTKFPSVEGGHCNKLYRTGDLVQYVGDGLLRYIGRRDSQAKIHGQRLELSEVEHSLREVLPAESQVLVAVIQAGEDEKTVLAGFVLYPGLDNFKDGKTESESVNNRKTFADPSEEFRQLASRATADLASRLPRYMIPSIMIPLSAIPTTPTGKSDRRQLARLASRLTKTQLDCYLRTSVEHRAPQTEGERLLYDLVEKLLQISDFGMDESFFSLGGDSICAMQLARLARVDAGMEISVDSIFRSPVLSKLALTMRPCRKHIKIPPFSLLGNLTSVNELLQAAQSSCRLASTEDIEDIYPCTPLQEGIMALSVSSPQLKYATVSTYRLPRAVALDRLRDAWSSVVASNPVLRTRMIQSPPGQLLQVVLKTGVEWESARDIDDLRLECSRWRIELGGALLRLVLVQSAQHEGNYLSVMMSHAIYDGWSLPQTLDQVEAAYHGGVVESTPFKLFVQHTLTSDMGEAKEFWQKCFSGFSEKPFPSAPAGQPNYRPTAGGTLKRALSISRSNTRSSALPNVISLAWAMTVSQYCGSNDVCFGITLAGRNVPVPGIEGILGPTFATIPLRVQLDRSRTVEETLSALHAQFVETMPFEQTGLQRIASFGAEAAAACRFQNHLVIQPTPNESAYTIFSQAHTREVVDNYMLSLEVTLPAAGSDSLHFEAAFDDSVVSEWLMGKIADQFCHNVREAISKTSDKLRDLSGLDVTGFGAISDWNRRPPPAVNCCVHDLVRRRCLGQPGRMAVEAFDGSWTYADLDRHATSFAARLQDLGAGPGAYVLVLIERSFPAVVSMLAVMMAGAAFVMLDPSTPHLRLEQVRDDADARLMITSERYATRAAELGLRAVIPYGDERWMTSERKFEPPSVSADDVVYAAFTSGSAGRPKGVVIQHRALATAATINGEIFAMDETSRVLHAASYAFDASIGEVFYTLVHGGCVCIPTETDSRNSLEDAINRFEVSWATLTPSLARALTPSRVRTLRVLALGGEAVSKVDVDMWAATTHLMNGYGPAECTIDSTVQLDVSLENGFSNIGFGAATVAWIVHPEDPTCNELVPLGAAGELVLEGPVVARGYLKNAAKTESSFVKFPDWLRRLRHGKSGRLYRTGDLVQYSSSGDGSLVYVGRKDEQVKLRGQRIELGEVEQHLLHCLPAAKEVIAEIVKPSDPGAEPTLAAFVLFTGQDQAAAGSASLDGLVLAPSDAVARGLFSAAETRMRSRVPLYMVPSLFLPLDRIPLNPTGKVNRRLLRETASTMSRKDLRSYCADTAQKRPPSTSGELTLQRAVSDVLRLPLEEVGMDDNFFQLGGDSITALKVAGVVKQTGLALTVAEIFGHPRLRDLAATLLEHITASTPREIRPFELLPESQRADAIQAAAVQCSVQEDLIEDMYPCTPMQEGLVAVSMKKHGQYVAEMAFDLPQLLDVELIKSAWEAVYAANPILRTRIVSPSHGPHTSLQAVVGQPLDWSSDLTPLVVDNGLPLHKAAICADSSGQKQLRVWLHHALYDGVSLPILLDQAEAVCNRESLSSRPFSPFVAYTSSLDVEASKRFWKSEFDKLDAAMFPPLPFQRSSDQRESVSCDIPLSESSTLDFTLPAVIQAACASSLGHYANTKDVVYGLTLSGRNAPLPGIGELVGPTITTVPFRVQLSPRKTAKELLLDIQSRLVSLIPHEQIGIRAIRSINSECAAACDFHCHLVIQPADEEAPNKVFRERELDNDVYSHFASAPLLLIFTPSADRQSIRLVANFDVSYISLADATNFTAHLSHVIQTVIRDADVQLQCLQTAGPNDLLQLQRFNTPARPRLDRLVHELVTDQCRRRPTAEAVCSWDGSLTYGQLEEASSRLKSHLEIHAIGANPAPVIALCMERSRWAAVAVLSVLKTGCACTLLDPSHPIERMKEVLRQTSVALLLASPETQGVAEVLATDVAAALIIVSPALLDSPPPSPPPSPRVTSPSDAAFVVFTSGSTGKPKGFVLEHTSISTCLRDIQEPMGMDERSRVLHFASYAFDASFFEVLGCWAAGGCLCIPSETDRASNLCEFIESHEVNWACMIPSTTHILDPSFVSSLRTLVLAGEAPRSADAKRWATRKDVRLINGYGPAECTIVCVSGQISPTEWTPGLIGPFVSGFGWVASPRNPAQLCAVGAIGELLIEGPILARGYIGDATKTAEAFIHSPPWLSEIRGHTESRLYRTGDLVRYTSNGSIQYISRRDRQLKLNGQRIEPAEIESNLIPCFSRGTAVIVGLVVPRSRARPRLFAFILEGGVSNTPTSAYAEDCPLFGKATAEFLALCRAAKQRLGESMPRYMIPAAFVPLNFLPRTGTGKIHYSLLTDAAGLLGAADLDSLSDAPVQLTRPSSRTETLIIELCEEILGLPVNDIGVTDNFFHLGGDSVLAMKLVAAARARGMTMTVQTVFARPRLVDMASAVDLSQQVEDSIGPIAPLSLISDSERESLLDDAAQQCSVERREIEDIYPCTAMQEGLIFQSMRSAGAYLGHFRYKLPRELDVTRFKLAWDRVIQANAILRTRIIQISSIYQVVIRGRVLFQTVELDSLDGLQSPLQREDLLLGKPLLQLCISRPRDHTVQREFLLVIHHALYDGMSLQLILDQVQQAYASPEKPRAGPDQQFNRFIDYTIKSNGDSARDYWLAKLSICSGAVFPMLPSSDYKPRTDAAIRREVRLAAFSDITLATVLEFAWAVTAAHYCDSEQVLYGLVRSGRNASLPGIEAIAGPTITTVPASVLLDRNESVVNQLRRLQNERASASGFEQFGLQNVRRLSSQAEAACQFQSLLLIQQHEAKAPSTGEIFVPAEDKENAGDFSTYALEITCEVRSGGSTITFDYDSNVLPSRQAGRILAQLAHTLSQIQDHWSETLAELNPLAPEAWEEIKHWNGLLPDPVERPVHDCIDEQCLASPGAEAVCAWDGSFTFKEVKDLSSRFAAYLRHIGVGPEVFVPILSEKSKWMAVSILGVVKAGGAVVLLDPAVPLQRLQTICSSVEARVILTSDSSLDVATKLVSTVVVTASALVVWEEPKAASGLPRVDPQSALYAIFTSGSTGQPKGIVISHAAFLTSGETQQAPLRLDRDTRTLQFASHMFDVSIADYLWTFLAGGCVCVASQENLRDNLAGAINELRVNRADLTPSIARVINPDSVPTLKTILLGGEPMSKHDLEMWSSIHLVNGYGPSECSVCCILADAGIDSDPSTIGRPYGVVPWVVDKDDHDVLLPIGSIGELVLEGHTLARGYLGEPAKTAKSFIDSSPSWLRQLRGADSRLYKTGDLVQYNPDGTLRYVGRKDTQIKIRGQRVELGEIEHQVREASPSAQDVVAEVVRPVNKGSVQLLVVFVSASRSKDDDSRSDDTENGQLFLTSTQKHRDETYRVVALLRSRLPVYMVPDVIIPLSHMPLSASGKADRRLLRDEAEALTRKQIENYQPRSAVKRSPISKSETALHQVAVEVLGLDPGDVGMDDSFFQLGGDSIIAIRLAEQARLRGFKFRVSDVFRTPKLSALAQLSLQADSEVDGSISDNMTGSWEMIDSVDKVEVVKKLASTGFPGPGQEILDILPVTQAAERYLFQPPEYWILNLRGTVNLDRLQQACSALVLRHGILRTVFVRGQDRHHQVVLSKIDTRIKFQETTDTIANFVDEYRRSDKIEIPTLNSPITEFLLAQGGNDADPPQALVVRLSHAQFDGYCLHTLWRDLKHLYECIGLPEAVSYSSHIQQWSRASTNDAFDFWRAALAGASPSRIDNTNFGDTDQHTSSNSVFITSTRVAPGGGASLRDITAATIVKTAWAAVLAKLAGSRDCVFAQASNGRNYGSGAARDVVGMCLNFIPVRAGVDPSWTVLELLESVQRQHYESLAFELLDFRDIVRRSTPWPSGAYAQSVLVHQNIDPDELFPFGDAEAWVTCSYEWPHPPDEILVESRPAGDGDLQVTLDTRSHILSQRNADSVVEQLCRLISEIPAMVEDPGATVGTLLATIG